jgi:hypothetical protein
MTIKSVFTNEGNEDDGSSEVKTEAEALEPATSEETIAEQETAVMESAGVSE